MKSFRNGVSYYSTYKLNDEVNFPESDVCCGWCKYLGKIRTLDRYFCRVTSETIYNIDRLSEKCPLEFEEETK